MAKISPSSIKYTIIADFVAEGPFQKPDVIGALFGQTEGLLGPDMELRELQKEGKIGRIEVELESEGGKTKGEIIIPTALDKTETSIIAAAIETIDKIGPTDAKISVREIEDVRGSKRDYIMERAKQLLSKIKSEGMDPVEIESELRESSRISKAILYGEEGLSAGPEVDSSDEIIVVEGRADVINLLKNGIKNAIGMMGTKFPKTIARLGETKKITLFVDGDRGGRLIAENVCNNANVAYIATAPDGKEVEELTGKEIHQALRKKVPAEEFLKSIGAKVPAKSGNLGSSLKLGEKEIQKIAEFSSKIKGRNVIALDSNLEEIGSFSASKVKALRGKDVFALVLSNATLSSLKLAEELGAKAIAAKTFGKLPKTEVQLISI